MTPQTMTKRNAKMMQREVIALIKEAISPQYTTPTEALMFLTRIELQVFTEMILIVDDLKQHAADEEKSDEKD